MSFAFTVETSKLAEAISKLNVIIPTKETQTLLSNVLFSVESDILKITASDMESTARISIQVKDASPGELIMRAKTIFQISKETQSKELAFKATEQENEMDQEEEYEGTSSKQYIVSIQGVEQGSTRYKMPADYSANFPNLTVISDDKLFKINGKILSEMIDKTFYSVSKEDSRYIYNGLCFLAEGNTLTFIGTDGRRLSALKRELKSPVSLRSEDSGDIVVYSKAIQELLQILSDETELSIGIEQKNIFFKVGNCELSSRLLDGKFPDHKKVIPETSSIGFNISTETLLHALNEVMVMAESPSFQVRLEIQANSILMQANTVDEGESSKLIPIDYSGDSLNICFNGSYLVEILQKLDRDTIRLEMLDESKPIMIIDPKDEDFIALIMPMRV